MRLHKQTGSTCNKRRRAKAAEENMGRSTACFAKLWGNQEVIVYEGVIYVNPWFYPTGQMDETNVVTIQAWDQLQTITV